VIYLNKAQEKLTEFVSIFQQHKENAFQLLKIEAKRNTMRKATVHLGPLVGIPKTAIRDAQKVIDGITSSLTTAEDDSISKWHSVFEKDYHKLEIFLYKCVILEENNTISKKKPKSFISKVRTVTTIESKLKHIFSGLEGLSLLGNKLMLKEDVKGDKKIEAEAILSTKVLDEVLDLWAKVQNNELEFTFNIDECEYFERKQEYIPTPKIEELLVAMTNTLGGIIVYGIKDSKTSNALDSNQRDKIQNQIANISRNNIKPKISPQFKTMIESGNKGFLFVYVSNDDKMLHTNNIGMYFKRVGSNNVKMTPDEVKAFYTSRK